MIIEKKYQKLAAFVLGASHLTIACSRLSTRNAVDVDSPIKTTPSTPPDSETVDEQRENKEPTSADTAAKTKPAITFSVIPDIEMTNNSSGVLDIPFSVFSADKGIDCDRIRTENLIQVESSDEKVLNSKNFYFLGGVHQNCRVLVIGNSGESGPTRITFTVNDGEQVARTSFSVNVKHANEVPRVSLMFPYQISVDSAPPKISLFIADPDNPIRLCNADTVFSEITTGAQEIKSLDITGQWPRCEITLTPNPGYIGGLSGLIWTSDGEDVSKKESFNIQISSSSMNASTPTPTPTPTQSPTDLKNIEAALTQLVQTGSPNEERLCVATLKMDHEEKFFDRVLFTLKAGEKYVGIPNNLRTEFTLYKFWGDKLNLISVKPVPATKVNYNCTLQGFVWPIEKSYEVAMKDLVLYSDPMATTMACTIPKGTSRQGSFFSSLNYISNVSGVFVWEVTLNNPQAACAAATGRLYYKRSLADDPFDVNGVYYHLAPTLNVYVK